MTRTLRFGCNGSSFLVDRREGEIWTWSSRKGGRSSLGKDGECEGKGDGVSDGWG